MSRLGADLSLEQIEDWFKIGGKVAKPNIKTVPRSKLGGRDLDPTTGKAAFYTEKQFVPPYKRHSRKNNPNQQAYSSYYKQLDDEEFANQSVQWPYTTGGAPSIGESSHGNLESLETDSCITGISSVMLPEGQSEAEALEVYKKVNLRHVYDNNLAITSYKDEIVGTIESNQVTIIQGETGSGKTTQVPQYILDHYARKNQYCNIVVTQPRIIAAQSISRRVCYERQWTLGDVCGYQVGMDKKATNDTRILYCTTGVLKRKLVGQKKMTEFTHVILDEVHERDRESDFCLLVVRKLLRTNSRDVKVILMSATFDTSLFAEYFALPVRGTLQPAPIFTVKGRSFTVAEYFIEDLKQLGQIPLLSPDSPGISNEAYDLAVKLIEQFDNLEAQPYGKLQDGLSKNRGSVLVFLPGLGEIQDLYGRLDLIKDKFKLWILPLHSSITGAEQLRVFENPQLNARKVILSTNIAESSITVRDIRYVIDFCLTKNLVSDPETNYCSLQPQWASRANCKQRKGRAGRVSNGRVYRMITKGFWDEYIVEFGVPEMQRCPLETLVLDTKSLDMGEPKAVLGLALSPPNLDDIERTILLLKEVGALASLRTGEVNRHDGDLTFLGKVLAALPVDVRFGKLMVLGHVFGLLEETVIIAAAVSSKTFHARPFNAYLQAYERKFAWAEDSFSDAIASLNAYQTWQRKKENGSFQAAPNAEKRWGHQYFIQIRKINEAAILVEELKKRLSAFNIRVNANANRPFTEKDQLVLKLVMAGAFYPNYFTQSECEEEVAQRMLCGKNPATTVVVKGLPPNQGTLYKTNLERMFHICDPKHKPNISVEETKAYIEFQRDPSSRSSSGILPAVYMAIKMRQLRMPLQIELLDSETTRQKMKQLSLLQEEQAITVQRLRTNRIKAVDETQEMNGEEGPRQVSLPPPQQSIVAVYVTEVKDCGHFWGHYADTSTWKQMCELQERLNSMQGRNLKPMEPAQIRVGTLCVAVFEDTSREFYRASIEELLGPRKVRVFYLDYGNDGVVQTFDLRQLEPEFLQPNFQSIEFELCGIKPSSVKCPSGTWTREAMERFEIMVKEKETLLAKIFSVVHGVLRVDLIEKLGKDREVHINDRLIQLSYADKCEESYESKKNHAEREEQARFKHRTSLSEDARRVQIIPSAQDSSRRDWMPIALDANGIQESGEEGGRTLSVGIRKRGGSINLGGPHSPYEMVFYSSTYVGRLREVRIDRDSVNSIVLTDSPQNQQQRMLVAASVGLNPRGTSMTMRDTTLMPPLDGLHALVAMLFAPAIELRADKQRTKFTGVLCGLGWDPDTGGPALPDHDIEIPFDTEITTEDISDINFVRIAINMVIGNETINNEWGPNIYKLQNKAREHLLRLVKKKRTAIEPKSFHPQYRWQMIRPEEIVHPALENVEQGPVLLNLHSVIALNDPAEEEAARETEKERERKYKEEMKEHIAWLRVKTSRSLVSEEIICRLCNEKLHHPRELMLHMATKMHRQREISLI